jgi:hypothetical protein
MKSQLRKLFVAGATLFVSAGFEARADPVFVNSSFETPNVGNNFLIDPTGPGVGWNFIGSSGVSGNNSLFTQGNPPAPDGTQVGILQNVTIFSQVVGGFNAGQQYTLSFLAAQRGSGGSQPSTEKLQVSVDGNPVGTFQPPGTNYSAFTTVPLLLTAGSHTFTFTGLGGTTGTDNTAFVDLVTITAIPEPASVVLAGLGSLGLLGLVRRRRASATS